MLVVQVCVLLGREVNYVDEPFVGHGFSFRGRMPSGLMSNLNLELLEISDEQALAAFESVAGHLNTLGLQSLTSQGLIFDSEQGRAWPLGEFRANVRSILAESGFLFRNLSANFQVQSPGGGGNMTFSRQASGTATVALTVNPPLDNEIERRMGIGIAFSKAFDPYHRRKIFAQLPPEIAEFYTRRESTLVRLEDIATRAAENTEAHRRLLDEQLELRRQKLDGEYQALAEQLRAEAAKRSQSLDEKERALAQRESDLEKADNTHARRKLRQDLKSALKERHTKFALTTETEGKRRPIVWSFLTLMAVTLGASLLFGWLATQPTAQGTLPWFPSVRLALSVASFAATTVYFIRWQDRWSQIFADEEFKFKRLDLDVDRASWLVEVLLEWRGADGREIPSELIDKLANGLFESGRAYPSATHPVEDAIASLLGSPSSLKLKLPGGEVNLDKKAIDRAKSASD